MTAPRRRRIPTWWVAQAIKAGRERSVIGLQSSPVIGLRSVPTASAENTAASVIQGEPSPASENHPTTQPTS